MAAGGLRRDAGRFSLLFASLGGMIGSGWLFGALNAAKIAGPSAIFAWMIGGAIVLLLAFVFAELSTMFPRAGAVIVFPQICFGPLAAMIMSWINFLAYVSVAPVEAVAVVNYANNFHKGLVSGPAGVLTIEGLIITVLLMVAFTVINLLAIKLVLAFNNAVTWWKLIVPALTVVTLLTVHFHAENFTSSGFAPQGAPGVLAAVSGSGIIFTFLGFRQAIELAGETRDPARSLPFAILGAVLFSAVLYVGLQIAFIGALSPEDLAHGWARLSFSGVSGPFAGLASTLGLIWLAVVLYADAAISPAGAGIIYNTTASRVIYATAEEGLMPKVLAQISGNGVPVPALILSFVAGLFFILPLPSWQQLATYLSSIGVLAYGIAPVVLFAFRETMPEEEFKRPFRLIYADVLAPLAFIAANLVVFWAGANVANHLLGGLLIAFFIYVIWQLLAERTLAHLAWRGAAWMAPYFAGLWVITDLGPVKGAGLLNDYTGGAVLAIFSVGILFLARACALAEPEDAREIFTEAKAERAKLVKA